MAASTGRRQNNQRRGSAARERGYANTYIDGNVVRQVQAVPARRTQTQRRQREQEQARTHTRRNRERALQMNMPYVAFLTAASVATVFACVNYLQLQAQGTSYREEIASIESQLSELKLANDNDYENIISSVDMEEVKEIAINELGMDYAGEGQIITYSSQEGDYIRQYAEIPAE